MKGCEMGIKSVRNTFLLIPFYLTLSLTAALKTAANFLKIFFLSWILCKHTLLIFILHLGLLLYSLFHKDFFHPTSKFYGSEEIDLEPYSFSFLILLSMPTAIGAQLSSVPLIYSTAY